MNVAAAGAPADIRSHRRAVARRDMVAVAWRLAERDGLANLSLRGLAAEVGMRAPSLYTYFDSKSAIFDAMFVEGYRQLDDLYDDLVLDPADPEGTLATAAASFLRFCQGSLPRYQLLFTRVVPDWQPSPDAYAASKASYGRMARALGSLGLESQRDLDLWTAITAGMAAQQLANDPGGDRWVQLSTDAAQMLVAHLRRNR